MEIGIDIEKNERFKNMSESMLKRIFTKREIEYCRSFVNYEDHFCAFWCVKEAFVKATSNKTINFLNIEITHNETGKPEIIKNTEIKNILSSLDFENIKISLSHSNEYSVATCLIY